MRGLRIETGINGGNGRGGGAIIFLNLSCLSKTCRLPITHGWAVWLYDNYITVFLNPLDQLPVLDPRMKYSEHHIKSHTPRLIRVFRLRIDLLLGLFDPSKRVEI